MTSCDPTCRIYLLTSSGVRIGRNSGSLTELSGTSVFRLYNLRSTHDRNEGLSPTCTCFSWIPTSIGLATKHLLILGHDCEKEIRRAFFWQYPNVRCRKFRGVPDNPREYEGADKFCMVRGRLRLMKKIGYDQIGGQ